MKLCYLTELVEPCGALPRKCLFIYLFIYFWMLLAENAALSARGFICDDGPELPKEKGQEAAQEGGETLEENNNTFTWSGPCGVLE
jgi:hypothetical protein